MLILATDMARHNEILEAFKLKCDVFDFTLDDHLNSVNCFVLLVMMMTTTTMIPFIQ